MNHDEAMYDWRDGARLRLVRWLDKQKFGPMVRARILRLNALPREGARLRGLHRKETYKHIMDRDIVGKGEALPMLGRGAWAILKRQGFVHKGGRREYLTRETIVDFPHIMLVKATHG